MNGPAPIEPEVEEALRPLVRLGLTRAEPVRVEPSGAGLLAEMEKLASRLASEHAGKAPGGIPGLEPAGKPLPVILNAVDLCNLCALRFLLPIGLYDADRIEGPVTLRRGDPGESYRGVRKDEVHLEGRPVLADQAGPFGNPTADSLRTGVTTATRSVWMVIFAPAQVPRAILEADVAWAREALQRWLGAPDSPVATGGWLLPDD